MSEGFLEESKASHVYVVLLTAFTQYQNCYLISSYTQPKTQHICHPHMRPHMLAYLLSNHHHPRGFNNSIICSYLFYEKVHHSAYLHIPMERAAKTCFGRLQIDSALITRSCNILL